MRSDTVQRLRARQGGTPSRTHQLALVAGAAGAIAITAALVAELGADDDIAMDRRVRDWVRGRRSTTVRRTLHAASVMGSVAVYAPVTLVAAGLVARRRGARQAIPMVMAVGGAAAMSHLVKRAVRRPRPPSSKRTPDEHPSFPSGHTTRATAAALTIAYALVREGVLPRAVAVPVSFAAAALVGASRTWADKHWTTDVVGGWALGAASAAGAALWYESVRAEAE